MGAICWASPRPGRVRRRLSLIPIYFRVEHQTEEGEAKRDDEHFVYAAVWEYKGANEAPELTKEPLNFEFVHPAQRNYCLLYTSRCV